MSRAEPMGHTIRRGVYLRQTGRRVMTPRQARRWLRKQRHAEVRERRWAAR